MKKVLMILFVGIISIGFISGCGKKTKEAITADQFNERIGSNYKLVDYTKNIGYAKKAYFYDSEGIYFYFYEGNRSFDMGNIYIDEVNNAQKEDKPNPLEGLFGRSSSYSMFSSRSASISS